MLDHTADVVRRAEARGEAAAGVDPVDAIESLLGPLYLRPLVTREAIDEGFLERLADRTALMLRSAGG